MEVPWGPLRLAIEAKGTATNAAGQLRKPVAITPPLPAALAISDILLGDSATAPARVDSRQQVRFWARSDSVYAPGGPVAIYWETYGFGSDTSERPVHFRVRVWLEDAGGRVITTALWRGATTALGLRQTDQHAVEWEDTRPLRGNVLPGLLLLTAPNDNGRYSVNVQVTDLGTGRIATTGRVIALEK